MRILTHLSNKRYRIEFGCKRNEKYGYNIIFSVVSEKIVIVV